MTKRRRTSAGPSWAPKGLLQLTGDLPDNFIGISGFKPIVPEDEDVHPAKTDPAEATDDADADARDE